MAKKRLIFRGFLIQPQNTSQCILTIRAALHAGSANQVFERELYAASSASELPVTAAR